MEKKKEMMSLADAVQEAQRERDVIDLVYDEKTGQFSQIPYGQQVSEGVIVTEMVNKGFA